MNDKLRLGWIGTGVMGHAMAGHLLASGYPLTVYNRTKARAEGLLACGARWADTPQEAARNSDVVFSIVGYPRDVEEVMLGEQGALSGLAEGGILCDMTTSSPELARRIAEAAAAKGCISLDAPVTGGDIGAREARLSIFVGGDKEAFERVRPCFEVMGKTILHCGDSGSGQKAKSKFLHNLFSLSKMMASVCTATRTMPVAADIMEHFARIETIFQCIKRKTIFRLTQNTKQVKHLLIVGPSIVACHAANNCVIAARMHGCSCSRTAFSGSSSKPPSLNDGGSRFV